ncbi:TonB-linked outer membrane protein, SusC/RagA family [compost metagenome]
MSFFNASVYRLREISLGYDLPRALMKKLNFAERINLSFSGRNLWFRAPGTPKYINYDPEVSSFGTSSAQGFDITGAPSAKRYGFNINVTF